MTVAGNVKFFELARERYAILLKRRLGAPRPWSIDPVFQREYFCNVFREDDKTTAWFRENIRDTVALGEVSSLLAIVIFRWFNKIAIGEAIKDILVKRITFTNELKELILSSYPKGPFVTGAYIIKTPDGMNKLDGVLWCIDEFVKAMLAGKFRNILLCTSSIQHSCELLRQAPYLGSFMSYQIACDARYTCLLENAPDIQTWAQPGPGSARGIGRTFYGDVDKFNYGSQKDQDQMIILMRELLAMSQDSEHWPADWPSWECSTVQHWACEVDKYNRAIEGGRLKRKFG